MKYTLFVASLILLYSCMCTPSADSVRIDGLYSENDTFYTKGSLPYFQLTVKPVLKYQEGNKKHCLTYSKVKAMDMHLNSIIPSSIKIICDKAVGTTQVGQPLENVKLLENNSILGFVDDGDLSANQTYEFKVSCTTTDSLKLEQVLRMTVRL